MKQLSQTRVPRLVVLFLGYAPARTRLIDCLIDHGCELWHTSDTLQEPARFDLAVSFGYRHILDRAKLDAIGGPVINLHTAYLPWNRGAHPNFWSFHDGTPSGVTIHLIDEGVDTGPILLQRKVVFDRGETTFAATHARLIVEIEDLFIEHIEEILEQRLEATPQPERGTSHRLQDLPAGFGGWHTDIVSEIRRLGGEPEHADSGFQTRPQGTGVLHTSAESPTGDRPGHAA